MSDALALSNSLADVVDRVAPAVVRIAGQSGSATGLAWDKELVVAAADSVDDEGEIKVNDAAGHEFAATLAGSDAGTGIAVLRATGLGAARLGDAGALRVGNLVLALARPGRSTRATFGMITTLGDAWQTRAGARIDRFIDTSLVLPGEFGGGVVVDAAGSLIGIGVRGGRHQRGIIVPSATLERAIAGVLAGKSGRRGYLGIATYPVRIPAGSQAAAGQERGLLVSEVEDDSPAASAGIALGDVVLGLGASRTEQVGDLFGALADHAPGAEVTARLLRGGAVRELKVTVGARPAR